MLPPPFQSPLEPAEGATPFDEQAGGWLPPGQTITLKGRTIHGMVYIGPRDTRKRTGPLAKPVIDPNLRVSADSADPDGAGIAYWPAYVSMHMGQRARYLDWLAGNRADPEYGAGYVFLYFYGLERRFFSDNSTHEERWMLVAEVLRLLQVYGSNNTISESLGKFVSMAEAVLAGPENIRPYYDIRGHDIPMDIRVALGHMARTGTPLTAEWLLSWLIHERYEWAYVRTPANRVFPEFRTLFTNLFDEAYPKGLTIHHSKRPYHPTYHAASAEYRIGLHQYFGPLPDVSRLTRPLRIAREIASAAASALDRYSRYLGRNPDARGTIAAHALLPERLRAVVRCAPWTRLQEWTAGVIAQGGLAPATEVLRRTEAKEPDKATKTQLTGAATMLAVMGTGMAPDARVDLRGPRKDEPVVLFELPEGAAPTDTPGAFYADRLLSMAVGAYVAMADGRISNTERAVLAAVAVMSDQDGLITPVGIARLRANLDWYAHVRPDLATLRRKLRGSARDEARAHARLAIACANADGVVSAEEVGALEQVYSALGLDKSELYAAVHAQSSRDEPVTVQSAVSTGSGFAIRPPSEPGTVDLDMERVSEVMAETQRAGAVLSEILQEGNEPAAPEPEPDAPASGFVGLDARHGELLRALLTRASWTESEYHDLSTKLGLMPDGAVETLDEWASDHFGEPLFMDEDDYAIDDDIRAKIDKVRQ